MEHYHFWSSAASPLARLRLVKRGDVLKTKELLFIILVIVLFIPSVFAVRLVPRPRVCAEYFKSESVFTGKVISVKAVLDSEGFYDGYWYRIKVYKVFRGKSKRYFNVYIHNDSGRFLIEVGKEYLLFAYREDNYLSMDINTNSCFLSEAKEKIHEIEEIPNQKDGEIECQVGPDDGLSGVKVKIIGKDRSYSAITNKGGKFCIKVKPGKYKAEIEPQRIDSLDYVFSAYDLSYDDPDSFSVPKGGCAEIAFWASLKR